MSAAESYTHQLIKPYSKEEKEWLVRVFKTTHWEMMTILNTWSACGYSKENTERVLQLASQYAIHPIDITSLFSKNVIS
jgi:hypothetical protein